MSQLDVQCFRLYVLACIAYYVNAALNVHKYLIETRGPHHLPLMNFVRMVLCLLWLPVVIYMVITGADKDDT